MIFPTLCQPVGHNHNRRKEGEEFQIESESLITKFDP